MAVGTSMGTYLFSTSKPKNPPGCFALKRESIRQIGEDVKIPERIASRVSFKYDSYGRRIQKAFTTEANPTTTTTTNYLYSGDNGIEEVDPNGNVLTRYAHGHNMDEPLVVLSRNS